MRDQRRDINLLEVLGEVGLGEGLDTFEQTYGVSPSLHRLLDVGVGDPADELLVGPRVNLDRLLEESVEEKPPVGGLPAVEAEGELVEVVGEVVMADAVVERPGEPALHERGDAVDSRHDDVSGSAGGLYVDRFVL